jgi:hypothetical protein
MLRILKRSTPQTHSKKKQEALPGLSLKLSLALLLAVFMYVGEQEFSEGQVSVKLTLPSALPTVRATPVPRTARRSSGCPGSSAESWRAFPLGWRCATQTAWTRGSAQTGTWRSLKTSPRLLCCGWWTRRWSGRATPEQSLFTQRRGIGILLTSAREVQQISHLS